jgi:hypothetical protein
VLPDAEHPLTVPNSRSNADKREIIRTFTMTTSNNTDAITRRILFLLYTL